MLWWGKLVRERNRVTDAVAFALAAVSELIKE
jgi:hypothetical protein